VQNDEEYELLPHEELEKLRQEVAAIKSNPIHGTRQAASLQNSVEELTQAVNNLITLFSNTNDQLIHDFRRTSVTEHFKLISEQNEQIAQGILTLADMMQAAPAPPPADLSSPANVSSPTDVPVQQEPLPQSSQASQLSQSSPSPLPGPGQQAGVQQVPISSQQNMQAQATQQVPSAAVNSSMPPPPPAAANNFDLPPPKHKKRGLFGK